MDESTIALLTGLLSVALGTAVMGAALAGAWLLGARYGSRKWPWLYRGAESTSNDNGHVAEIARALQSVTLELQRVSDAQRYTALVLAQLQASQPGVTNQLPSNPARSITPH
ncbi:MAG TPA: hypothetical protein VGJ12_16245 [Gemmatimonadaceae bacterium]|jgi:hypothetical protein